MGMRILHVDGGRALRGGQRQVLMLMAALRDAGHESELLADPAGELWDEAAALGIHVGPSGLSTMRKYSRDATLVHVHDSNSHTLAAVASRAPFVVSRRVAFPVRRSLLSRWKYTRPRRFLAVSQYVARQLAVAGVQPELVDVVFDGVEMPSEVPPPHAADSQFRVVALASHDPEKGRDLVHQAAQISKLPVLFSEELALDLPGASVFLYLSRAEGLGSAALLAMSYGVPVIASRIGGLPEAVIDGQCGLLVENDPKAVARCLEQLKSDRELAGRLGANARRRVEAMFTSQHLLERTLASYERALAA